MLFMLIEIVIKHEDVWSQLVNHGHGHMALMFTGQKWYFREMRWEDSQLIGNILKNRPVG